MARSSKSRSSSSKPVWKDPGWLTAIAAVIAAIAGPVVLILTSDGGDGTSSPTSSPDNPDVTQEPIEPFTVEPSAAPITVGVEWQAEGEHNTTWVFGANDPSPEEFQGNTLDDAFGWLNQHGRPAGQRTVKLTLRGTAQDPVVITGLSARIASTSRPSAVWGADYAVGCGEIPVRAAFVNLDDPALRFSWTDPDGMDSGPPTLRVDESDIEVIEVTAAAHTRDVEWRLVVTYEYGGQTGEFLIDDDGAPFSLAGWDDGTEALRINDLEDVSLEPSEAPLGSFC